MVRTLQKKLLNVIYDWCHWNVNKSYCCKKTCSTCCTSSVNITSLEGELINEFMREQGIDSKDFRRKIEKNTPRKLSTNSYVRRFLEGNEVIDEDGTWDYQPCIYLINKQCQIYPARPFACRSMVSMSDCGVNGEAVVKPETVTLNTICMQLIEHIDQGGVWGNLNEVLDQLENNQKRAKNNELAVAEPAPGFMIPEDEKQTVLLSLSPMFEATIAGRAFKEYLNLPADITNVSRKRSSCP